MSFLGMLKVFCGCLGCVSLSVILWRRSPFTNFVLSGVLYSCSCVPRSVSTVYALKNPFIFTGAIWNFLCWFSFLSCRFDPYCSDAFSTSRTSCWCSELRSVLLKYCWCIFSMTVIGSSSSPYTNIDFFMCVCCGGVFKKMLLDGVFCGLLFVFVESLFLFFCFDLCVVFLDLCVEVFEF